VLDQLLLHHGEMRAHGFLGQFRIALARRGGLAVAESKFSAPGCLPAKATIRVGDREIG